jgi:hypothetical protein
METHAQQTRATRVPAYDRVVVRDGEGKRRQLSRNEFERLPLRERVTYLIGGTAEFFAGTEHIPASEAMKG